MPTPCPSCNRFCTLELQEPEVNEITLNFDNEDPDSATVTYDVRIVRNSECCGDEMKEASFSEDAEVPDEIIVKMKEKLAVDAEAEFEVNEGSPETIEEGGHRYKKSYYGFTLPVQVSYKGAVLGEFDITDKIEASGMDELN